MRLVSTYRLLTRFGEFASAELYEGGHRDSMTIERNAEGCLLGLACGDAPGRPVEFKSTEEIASQHGEVTEMLGHGTHGQPPGTITDDTEMALCIAESLVDRRGFDPADVADRFVDWIDSDPFDIGLMTRDSRPGSDRERRGTTLARTSGNRARRVPTPAMGA